MFKIGLTSLAFSGLLALGAPATSAQAALVQFQFNGTQTGGSATVQALLGIDSSLVVPNGSFTQANLSSFSVTYNGSFTASSSAIPASLSGQFNDASNGFFSLASDGSLAVPSYSGTNNFQFFNPNGQQWNFTGSGSVSPPFPGFNFVGAGTWTVAAVPVPAALWLFGSGIAALGSLAKRRQLSI